MKRLVIALLPLLMLACKGQEKPAADALTEKDKEAINLALILRNSRARTQYRSDSMLERTRMEVKQTPADEVKKKMDAFYGTWNTGINQDTAVTMEKYLQFCKERNADPKEAYQFLN